MTTQLPWGVRVEDRLLDIAAHLISPSDWWLERAWVFCCLRMLVGLLLSLPLIFLARVARGISPRTD